MKLTKKQRIALEFLAEVGPVSPKSRNCQRVLHRLYWHDLARLEGGIIWSYRITRKGREALKEAQR